MSMKRKEKQTVLNTKLKTKERNLLNKYGLTLKEWQKMWDVQKGVCWICEKLPKSGILCVDHRHVVKYKKLSNEDKKKEVRALLCFMCNTMLHGVEKRNTARQILERMVKYFNKYKIKGDV